MAPVSGCVAAISRDLLRHGPAAARDGRRILPAASAAVGPAHRRPWRTLAIIGIAVATLASALVPPAHAIRVTTWNLLNYPNLNLAGRQPHFRTVMGSLPTDVMIVQELFSQAGTDSFLAVLKSVQPKRWMAAFVPTAESAVYWDSSLVDVANITSFNPPSGPRDVLICVIKPWGYLTKAGWFRVYSAHFKAGTPTPTTADSTTRRLECGELRNTINNINPTSAVGPNFILGGDSNFYGDWEGGYIRLTESQADNDGRCKDLLTMGGTWNNGAYATQHTQSPCNSGCVGSTGGMDDRFDLWLYSYTLQDGQGLDVVPSGYIPYGNDGLHFNQDINAGGFNNAVGITIANALWAASDHLPVVLTLQLPSRVVAASELGFGDVITGGLAQRTLMVSNGAVAPADALNYSFAAPADFTAPGGGFIAATGGGANAHTIGMDTATIGAKSGTLTVTTDDPDSLAKSVLLSGRVLAHAEASLDSAALSTAAVLDLGTHQAGGFSNQAARVHNFDYDPLQARLSVNSGVITGGAGRFSLVGGFSTALLSGTGTSYSVHFDDAGATTDSTYEATLTFQSSDEALPGAAAAADLVVTLRARVSSTPTSASDALPKTLQFYPPSPNPFTGMIRFAFDLPEAAPVSLEIFDLSGRRVASIVSGVREAGRHQARWQGTDESGARVPAGLYFARFIAPGLKSGRRIAVLP